MPLKDLKALLSETRAKWQADKSDKKARKAFREAKAALAEFRAAKAALAKEKEATANKKRPAEEINEQPPKKKFKAKTETVARRNLTRGKNPSNKRIVMRNLSAGIDDEKLKEFWKDCGELVDVTYIRPTYYTQKKGSMAMVEFATQKEADKAILKTGTMLMGRELKCSYSSDALSGGWENDGIDYKKCKRIHISNLSDGIDYEKCKEFWKDCGELVDVHFITNKENQQFRGMAIAEFATQEEADKAILKTGTMLMGRRLKCQYAKPIRKKPPCPSIYMGNLSDGIDYKKCKEFWKDCGEQTVLHRRSRGFIVEFTTQEEADKAILKTGTMFMGRRLKLNWVKKNKHKEMLKNAQKKSKGLCDKIFLRNVADAVKDDTIRQLFKECGDITTIYWFKNRKTGKKNGGFVQFANPNVALPIAIALNGTELYGKKLNMTYSFLKSSAGNHKKYLHENRKKNELKKIAKKMHNTRKKKHRPPPPDCDTICLRNVADTVNDKNIYQLFKECGDITKLTWKKDKKTGKFAGWGFVQFVNPGVALPIAIACDGMQLGGKELSIRYWR